MFFILSFCSYSVLGISVGARFSFVWKVFLWEFEEFFFGDVIFEFSYIGVGTGVGWIY